MRSYNSISVFVLALAGVLFQYGWGLEPLALDETDLGKVSTYYYQPGKKTVLSSDNKYPFLSQKSRGQISLDEWNQSKKNDIANTTTSVSVLGEKKLAGHIYAVVSLIMQMPNDKGLQYNEVVSRTWIQESGKWRTLNFPKTREKFEKRFQDGDLVGAKTVAEEWLVMDPFSVDAYNSLGNAIDRIGEYDSAVPKPAPLSKDDILSALLAINPDDTAVLVHAVAWAKTPSIAKSYLEKLKGTDGHRVAAFNFANTRLQDMNARLEFLRDMEITPDLAILKMQALVVLLDEGSKKYTWADFQKVAATEGSFDKLKTFLDKSDSTFAVDWADKLFHFFSDAKDDAMAQKWRDYRTARRSNDVRFKALVGPGQAQDTGHLLMVP